MLYYRKIIFFQCPLEPEQILKPHPRPSQSEILGMQLNSILVLVLVFNTHRFSFLDLL